MKSDKMAEDIANPGSALEEAIGALLEKEIHRILKPLAEESGCIYVTAGPVNPKTGKVTKLILTDGDGNEYNVDSVIINSWSKPSKRLLRSFEVELFEISFNDICDALSPYQIDYRWAEKDRRRQWKAGESFVSFLSKTVNVLRWKLSMKSETWILPVLRLYLWNKKEKWNTTLG